MTENNDLKTKMDIVNAIDWRLEAIDEARTMVQCILADDMDRDRLLAVFHVLDGAVRAYRQLSEGLLAQHSAETKPAA